MSMTKANLPKTFDELVKFHKPHAITDEAAYQQTMDVIDSITSLPRLSPGQEEYLNTLAILADAYENEKMWSELSNIAPVEVLRELMAARDMNASDLGRLLGERSLGPKILNEQRELSKSHIRVLAAHFQVSPALFI